MSDINEIPYASAIVSDLTEVFVVDKETEKITVVRHNEEFTGVREILKTGALYSLVVDSYIQNNVYADDRNDLSVNMNLNSIACKLESEDSINIYYRVFRNGEIHYLRLKCNRVGTKEEFKDIIFVFMPALFSPNQFKQLRDMGTDEITGLYTRDAFFDRANKILAENPDKEFDLFVADVENFKRINRLYGRAFGDDVLRYLAGQYSQTAKGGICGRVSGDQFVALVPAASDKELKELYGVVDRIRAAAPVPYMTVRYGINHKVDKRDSAEDMFDKSMLAIRSKKNFHDDPLSFYDEEVIKKHVRAQMYESEFEEGIAENQFVIWCQPKYDTVSMTMNSAEALLRWKKKDGTIIPPSDFIPVFEANGLIVKLDEYVFRCVCEHQRKLIDEGYEPLPISVNMSRTSLFRGGGVKKYKEIIEGYGLPKRLVPIELTESATVENDQIGRFIDDLKSEGFVLHMDDFGSGYSSLSNLSSLHFDAVKIDKSLVDGIGTPRGEEVIRHIVGMAHFFMMEVIAEGVEQRSQYKFLKKLECDTIQGYYFSKPVPFEEFIKRCKDLSKGQYKQGSSANEYSASGDGDRENSQENRKAFPGSSIVEKLRQTRLKLYKGENNDIFRANAFALKCMWISILVLAVCWLLDVMNVFIVDLHIMNTCIVGSIIICLIIYLYARIGGIDRPGSKYVIMSALVVLYSFIFMELAYHTTLVMVFPLLCAMMYFDRKLTIYTYIITCVGYAAAVLIGFKVGLCDSNMLLLTYTNSAFHSAALTAGDITINDNSFLMFLFFVAPRWLLLLAIMPLLSHVASDIQKRTKREAKIRHMAEIDGLTGVYNRYKFVQSINSYYPGCEHISVLYFDVNNLKEMNDSKGHESGDKLICGLADELLKRESDNCKTYRIGGDEFVMVLEKNDAYRVEEIKKDIIRAINNKKIGDGIKLSVAVGAAMGAGKNIEGIINEADEKMYKSKLKMKEMEEAKQAK